MIPRHAKIRICRSTNDLEGITNMYVDGLGFKVLGSFDRHDNFSGRMGGHPDHVYHLEFTVHDSEPAGRAPSRENMLVFYVTDSKDYDSAIGRLVKSDFKKVKSFNPYWEGGSQTFEDLDGYRVVICNDRSPF